MKQPINVLHVSQKEARAAKSVKAMKVAGYRITSISVVLALQNVAATLNYEALVLEETAPIDDGVALLKKWRESEETVPPILYVGRANLPTRIEEIYALGVTHYIYRDSDEVYLFLLPQAIQQSINQSTTLLQATNQIEVLAEQNDDLASFADSVAHDLKNPITHFLSYADFLRENHRSISPEEITEHIEIILHQSRKMQEIIDILLLLARVRSAEELELTKLNMAQIVKNALDRLHIEIQESNAQIDLPDLFPDSIGYGPWVENVWVNYLSNGLKYGGEPPVLRLGYTVEADEIRFWIADSGRGLTEQEQALLYTPFPRIQHPKIKRGHGLGLSIIKRIVERLDGRVDVESIPNRGSCFSFTLPKA